MTEFNSFPIRRLRRFREKEFIRKILQENTLNVDDLIYPIFVSEGITEKQLIKSMPGIYRHSLETILYEIEKCSTLKIPAVAIFPVINQTKKDNEGSEAFNENGLIPQVIKKIKNSFPEIGVISDVALDPYTSHGQDGFVDQQGKIDNDKTIQLLRKQALVHARAGADIIAPSDMMDGRIIEIRKHLDSNNFYELPIMSYSSKFSSAFYGPFRDAVKSSNNLSGKNKDTYQINVANFKEAFLESYIDIQEGADFLMVKPGMPYLDVLFNLTQKVFLPVFAYQVSGEYAMLKNAVNNGILSESVILESLISFKRAGARGILSYFAIEIAEKISS